MNKSINIKKINIFFKGINSISGRNNSGKITVHHKGGGIRRKYRLIDFYRQFWYILGFVIKVEQDPIRSANIALIFYQNGVFSYILAPDGLISGNIVEAGINISFSAVGNAIPLKYIPLGTYVHNIEIYFGKGGKLVRSAGTVAKILKKRINYVLIRLASGEEKFLLADCTATIGRVSNINNQLKNLKKAGISRYLGKRPHVRGSIMNPIDHPLGGRTKGGKIPCSAWGVFIGKKTVRKKNKFIIKLKKK